MRFPFDPTQPGATLAACEAAVHAFLPEVPEITAERLAMMAPPPILLDVRNPEEHATSHIAGARLAPPGTPPLTRADRESATPIVLFCSVGLRSGRLAAALLAEGLSPHRIRNLRGGLFRWARLGFPMVDAAGSTAAVHPFDPAWARLLAR